MPFASDSKEKKMMAGASSHDPASRRVANVTNKENLMPEERKKFENLDQWRIQRFLAAKRRVLEQEVWDLLSAQSCDFFSQPKSENHRTTDATDDGYEEIKFGDTSSSSPPVVKNDEHHYLTPIATNFNNGNKGLLNISRKSNSDSDLLTLDENKEFEILCRENTGHETDVTFNSEPEQGFYRVYDDLEKVRTWDLIPYVLARKMREKEEFCKVETPTTVQKASSSSSTQDEAKTKIHRDNGSRISLDSGHLSLASGHFQQSQQQLTSSGVSGNHLVLLSHKRPHSDSGSSCSADSGTYNLFDDLNTHSRGGGKSLSSPTECNKEVLMRASLQLNSIKNNFSLPRESNNKKKSSSMKSNFHHNKRRPPPPPKFSSQEKEEVCNANPTLLRQENNFLSSTCVSPPPPLPPRLKCIQKVFEKEDEPHQQQQQQDQQQQQPPPLKRKDLSSYFGLLEDEPNQLLSKEVAQTVALQNLSSFLKNQLQKEDIHTQVSSLKPAESLNTSPGKKDLNKFLGIDEDFMKDLSAATDGSNSNNTGGNSLFKRLSSSPILQKHQRASPKCLIFQNKAKNSSTKLPPEPTKSGLAAKITSKKIESCPDDDNSSALGCRRELDFSQQSLAANDVFLVGSEHDPPMTTTLPWVNPAMLTTQSRTSRSTKAVQTSISPVRQQEELRKKIEAECVLSCTTPKTSRRCTRLFRNPLRRSATVERSSSLRRRRRSVDEIFEKEASRMASSTQKAAAAGRTGSLKRGSNRSRRSSYSSKCKDYTPRKSFMASLLSSASYNNSSKKRNGENFKANSRTFQTKFEQETGHFDVQGSTSDSESELDDEIESVKSGSERRSNKVNMNNNCEQDEFAETVREAMREGLPVIPFCQTPQLKHREPKIETEENSLMHHQERGNHLLFAGVSTDIKGAGLANGLTATTTSLTLQEYPRSCTKVQQPLQLSQERKGDFPNRQQRHHHATHSLENNKENATATPIIDTLHQNNNNQQHLFLSVPKRALASQQQQSSLYLSMSGGPGTPNLQRKVLQKTSHQVLGHLYQGPQRPMTLWPPQASDFAPGTPQKREEQHCQSCTCGNIKAANNQIHSSENNEMGKVGNNENGGKDIIMDGNGVPNEVEQGPAAAATSNSSSRALNLKKDHRHHTVLNRASCFASIELDYVRMNIGTPSHPTATTNEMHF